MDKHVLIAEKYDEIINKPKILWEKENGSRKEEKEYVTFPTACLSTS